MAYFRRSQPSVKTQVVTKRLFSFLKVSDSRWKVMAILPLFIIVLFTIASWCFPLPKTRLHAPPSRIVLDRNGEWLRAFLAKDGMWRFSLSVSQLSVSQLTKVIRLDRKSPPLTDKPKVSENSKTLLVFPHYYTKRC